MPFVSNMPDDQQEKAPSQGAVPATGGAPVQLSPSSGIIGAGTPTGTPGGGTTVAPAGGQFASLNQYLSANQGQAEPLAGKITAGINRQYNTLQGQNTSTLNDINKQIATNALPAGSQNTLAQEAANPISFADNPGNIASFQSLLNASYGGPTSAESTTGFTNQQNAINNAISSGQQATQTEAGREGLIAQNEATPTTSTTALNSAILSSSPTASSSVENAYKPFSNLLTGLQTGAQAADQNIAQTQGDITQANTAANAAIANQTQGLNTAVNNQLQNAQQQNANFTTNYNNLIGGGLSTGSISNADAALLGLTPDQQNALNQQAWLAANSQYMTAPNFGANSQTSTINFDQFLNQQNAPADITANQVATPEQFQTLMALINLNNGQVPTGAVLNPNAASQANTYTAPTLAGAFNYNQALQNATSVEQQERADAQAKANAMSAAALAQHNAKKGFLSNITSPFGTLLSYVANPIAAVPGETQLARKI